MHDRSTPQAAADQETEPVADRRFELAVKRSEPVLVAASHGTDNPDGQRVVRELLRRAQAMRPTVHVVQAFVDVQRPSLVEVLAELPRDADVVIVPVLLTVGFHTQVDIAQAAAARAGTRVAAPLGPDPRLTQLLLERFREAGGRTGDGVVIAVAGSTVAAAMPSFAELRTQFQRFSGAEAVLGYGAALEPRVPTAVAVARERAGTGRASVASYLLTPGFFHDRVLESGAEIVSAPLGVDDRIARVILDRYNEVVSSPNPDLTASPSAREGNETGQHRTSHEGETVRA